MNRSEIEAQLEVMKRRVRLIDEDLKKFPVELSAVSQVSMIAARVQFEADIKELEGMLEILDFEDIIKDQFE